METNAMHGALEDGRCQNIEHAMTLQPGGGVWQRRATSPDTRVCSMLAFEAGGGPRLLCTLRVEVKET